jgi:glycosyltransferase involved in cell wall biosynthesis
MAGNVSLFIPAYNAASTLSDVIDRVPGSLWERVQSCWIINDGSTDDTDMVIDALQKRNPIIKKQTMSCNGGYGKAVKKGLSLCRAENAAIAVCLHADGQYPPEAIPEAVAIMEMQNIDILQGSRIASGTALSGGMPLYKYVAGRILTSIENRVFGLSLTDYHSGFLCYGYRALASIPFDALSTSFDFDLEVIASARARHLRIAEMPIATRYAGEVSHLRPIQYGLRVLGVVGRYALGRYREVA